MNEMKVQRCKSKEHTWRFKDSFRVTAYRFTGKDGNTYIAYAHSFGDLGHTLISKVPVATYSRDCEDHFEERKRWSCLCNKDGKSIHKPFWYYGRIYQVIEKGGENLGK
jgi:hypothetical protein